MRRRSRAIYRDVSEIARALISVRVNANLVSRRVAVPDRSSGGPTPTPGFFLVSAANDGPGKGHRRKFRALSRRGLFGVNVSTLLIVPDEARRRFISMLGAARRVVYRLNKEIKPFIRGCAGCRVARNTAGLCRNARPCAICLLALSYSFKPTEFYRRLFRVSTRKNIAARCFPNLPFCSSFQSTRRATFFYETVVSWTHRDGYACFIREIQRVYARHASFSRDEAARGLVLTDAKKRCCVSKAVTSALLLENSYSDA